MTLTLHAAPGTVALAVHAALEEAGADYRVAWLDFKAGDQTAPAFLAVNPKARVPALVTPQGVLTETPATLEWIAATHPDAELMPTDPWQAAKVREAMSYLASTVHVNHAHKMRGHRWTGDAAAQAAMTAEVPRTMRDCADYLEARLDSDWLVGEFSVADLHLFVVLRWLDGDGVPLAEFPKLSALKARIEARPAVARILPQHAR
ncbi:glutathione S-transferase family protein [Jannaschia sp. KMU-145]|uniref:glutathione S-transferase family protein n=1 Tax=Jannaschia halovivens TaxID=3388667 RepID=UPI00396AFF5C